MSSAKKNISDESSTLRSTASPASTAAAAPSSSSNSILRKIGRKLVNEDRIPVTPTKGTDIFFYQIDDDPRNEVSALRDEYFQKAPHEIFENPPIKRSLGCADPKNDNIRRDPISDVFGVSCHRLNGRRGPVSELVDQDKFLANLKLADAWFAMCYEELGTFEMLGSLIDQYTTKGDFRIPGNDTTGIQLEAFTQMIKSGYYPTSRIRVICYSRLLGMLPRQLKGLKNPDTKPNSAFSKLFPQLIHQCLLYYRETRIVDVIQQATTGTGHTATVTEIRNTSEILFQDEDLMIMGNSYNILLDIMVYLVGTIDLVRNTRDAIGISSSQDKISEYITSAYAKLVKKEKKVEPNRHHLYTQLAETGRTLLMAFEKIDKDNNDTVKELLDEVEPTVEEFNNAYRTLYGVNLADGKNTKEEINFVQTI